MKLVILSDNHTNYDFETPDGDILIHCGDFTYHGKPSEIEKFRDYLKEHHGDDDRTKRLDEKYDPELGEIFDDIDAN